MPAYSNRAPGRLQTSAGRVRAESPDCPRTRSPAVPTIQAAALEDFARRIFEAVGADRDEAAVVAASLVGANLRGHDSDGIMRLIQYVGFVEGGIYQLGAGLAVERETAAMVACDAGWGFGQVQAHRLLDRIIPKAQALGIAAGTARRCG